LKLPIGAFFQNYALSADGNVMAANLGGEMFRWVRGKGYTDLGPTDGSIAISADGSAITSGIVGADGLVNASLWKTATGWVNLGHTAKGCNLDGSWGSSYGLNADGSVVVGLAWYCPGAQGFRWSSFDGMVGLSHPTGASSRASGISADGSTVVGFYEDPRFGNRRPVRWAGRKKDLFAGANSNGEAIAVSSDGSQIAGVAADATGFHAFYFTDAVGMISLGTVSGQASDQSVAASIANNGTVVGWSGDLFGGGIEAFIWGANSPKSRMRSMKEVLTHHGAKIPNNVTLTNALAVSGDGKTIVGTWQDTNFNFGGWMARFQ
jgi:probable HAF family extracellular repeat protein